MFGSTFASQLEALAPKGAVILFSFRCLVLIADLRTIVSVLGPCIWGLVTYAVRLAVLTILPPSLLREPGSTATYRSTNDVTRDVSVQVT